MIRRVFLAFLVFALVACGDNGTGNDGTDEESITGTYTLQSIDGDPLPWVLLQVGADMIEVIAGSVTLNEDMTCSDIGTFRITTITGNVTTNAVIDLCTYTIDGGALTLTSVADNTVTSGSIVGSALTLTNAGFVLIYRK